MPPLRFPQRLEPMLSSSSSRGQSAHFSPPLPKGAKPTSPFPLQDVGYCMSNSFRWGSSPRLLSCSSRCPRSRLLPRSKRWVESKPHLQLQDEAYPPGSGRRLTHAPFSAKGGVKHTPHDQVQEGDKHRPPLLFKEEMETTHPSSFMKGPCQSLLSGSKREPNSRLLSRFVM